MWTSKRAPQWCFRPKRFPATRRRSINVVYGEQAGLHVSGHAAQEELKLMLNLLRPLYFVPMHGEYRMLQIHARLAYELGFAPSDVFVLDKGQTLELGPSGARLGDKVQAENVFVDGALVGDVGHSILRDRLALSQDGFVIARVAVEAETGQVIDDPQIISQGCVYVPESTEVLRSAEAAIVEVVERIGGNGTAPEEIGRQIKRRLEKLFYDETRRRPMIIPMVTKG